MGVLNDWNEDTKRIVHLVITTLCDRNCRYCSNKSYNLDMIQHVTDEELRQVEIVFLTGGEPFAYSNPCAIAAHLKRKYPNIKQVIAYTSAVELHEYLLYGGDIYDLDGITISIKNVSDQKCFDNILVKEDKINGIVSKYLYVFDGLNPESDAVSVGYTVIQREWQKEDYVPTKDSFFRLI